MPRIVGASTAGGWQDATPLTVPEGVAEGHLLLACLSANGAPGVSPPPGWELVPDGSVVGGNLGVGTAVRLYVRPAGGDEAGAAHVWQWEAEHNHHGILLAVAGADGMRAVAVTANSSTDSLNLPSLDAIAGDMLAAFAFHWSTAAGTGPTIDGLETVAAQSTILLAAHEALAEDGPTPAHPCTSTVAGRMAAVAILLRPEEEPPEPTSAEVYAEHHTPPEQVYQPRWTYHAMRIPSRVWLDRDLPLQDVSLGPELSGPYSLSATLDPEWEHLIADDGQPLLLDKATLIVAECDDVVRGAAILTKATVVGSKLTLECAGHSSFAAGQEFEGTRTWGGPSAGTSGAGVDPLDVIRHMWTWLQAQPDGDLGITLGGTTTRYRVGSWHNARRIEEDGSLGPATEIADPFEFDGDLGTITKPVAARGKSVYWQYVLGWWDSVDIAGRMDELAQRVPFDYVETSRWSDPDKADVDLGIVFGYPRIGAKRPEVSFIVGENVAESVEVTLGRDDYANRITVHGAGEGAAQLRASASIRDGRLRHAETIEATHLTSVAACRALATDTLNRRRHSADVTSFTAINHPSAPIGAYSVGDEVQVQTGPGWSHQLLWVRITALDIDPDTEITTITCSRADAWDYSGGSAA